MEEATEHQEFPKILFLNGEVRTEEGRPVPHQNTRTVADAEEEADARSEGFTEANEPEAPQVAEEGEGGDEAEAPESGEAVEGADQEPVALAEAPEQPEAPAPDGE